MAKTKKVIKEKKNFINDQDVIPDQEFSFHVEGMVKLSFQEDIFGIKKPISVDLRLKNQYQLELIRAIAHMRNLHDDEISAGEDDNDGVMFSLPEQGLTFGFPY